MDADELPQFLRKYNRNLAVLSLLSHLGSVSDWVSVISQIRGSFEGRSLGAILQA
jgi:hypothetical protein